MVNTASEFLKNDFKVKIGNPSLISAYDEVRYTDPEERNLKNIDDLWGKTKSRPIVLFFYGRRGQGKTLAMTSIAKMIASKWAKLGMKDHQVFSNYGTDFSISSPYMLDEIIEFPNWAKNGLLCIDEVGSAFPSARAMSTVNVLFTNMLTQLRKRKLEVCFTTQFPQMISYGVLTQVDLFVLCESIKGGRSIRLYFFDHWGQYTSKMWQKKFPQPKHEADWILTLHNTDKIWGSYNTEEVIASLQSTSRTQIIEDQYHFQSTIPDKNDTFNQLTDDDPVKNLIIQTWNGTIKNDPSGLVRVLKKRGIGNIETVKDLDPYLSELGWSLITENNKIWAVKND